MSILTELARNHWDVQMLSEHVNAVFNFDASFDTSFSSRANWWEEWGDMVICNVGSWSD